MLRARYDRRRQDEGWNLKTQKSFFQRAQRFYHDNAVVGGHMVLFFFFIEADTGIAALTPGVRGAMEVARSKLKSGLPDPRTNRTWWGCDPFAPPNP